MLGAVHKEMRNKMAHTLEVLSHDLAAVRTGRASPGLLNPVMVSYYGTSTPINQIANVATPDPQLITITPYDKSIAKDIEKAIAASDLGLNPSIDGGLIRVPIPVLTEERRKELVKHVKHMGEESKIALRNIRRDANDKVKKLQKEKSISEDEEHDAHAKIQSETDGNVKIIDELIQSKEKDLMTV